MWLLKLHVPSRSLNGDDGGVLNQCPPRGFSFHVHFTRNAHKSLETVPRRPTQDRRRTTISSRPPTKRRFYVRWRTGGLKHLPHPAARSGNACEALGHR
jgi:hypothetical protein